LSLFSPDSGIPDIGRFSLRTAHAVLRSNLPLPVAHATATGSHTRSGQTGKGQPVSAENRRSAFRHNDKGPWWIRLGCCG